MTIETLVALGLIGVIIVQVYYYRKLLVKEKILALKEETFNVNHELLMKGMLEASGAIERGFSAVYDMQGQVNGVKKELKYHHSILDVYGRALSIPKLLEQLKEGD